jgi:hypothetical protein
MKTRTIQECNTAYEGHCFAFGFSEKGKTIPVNRQWRSIGL